MKKEFILWKMRMEDLPLIYRRINEKVLDGLDCRGLYYPSDPLGREKKSEGDEGSFVFGVMGGGYTIVVTRGYLKRILKMFENV